MYVLCPFFICIYVISKSCLYCFPLYFSTQKCVNLIFCIQLLILDKSNTATSFHSISSCCTYSVYSTSQCKQRDTAILKDVSRSVWHVINRHFISDENVFIFWICNSSQWKHFMPIEVSVDNSTNFLFLRYFVVL